jgi:[ribosomal protein S5]-alanine N-acetyltransferase
VPMPEIGYLVHRPFWRKGYATEAALGVRDHAFHARNEPFVISQIRPINTPSQCVARKLGMRPVKLFLNAGLEHVLWRVDRDQITA